MTETSAKQAWTLKRTLPYLFIIFGILGLLASSILLLEKMELLADPSYQPSCNLNPVISCGSVMVTEQASIFGFSNSLVGIAGFASVITIGFTLLAGAKFKRWFWLCIQLGTIFGLSIALWLFYQGVYKIGAVCPYCALIWVTMIVLFWYTLLYNIREKNIILPKKLKRTGELAQKYHGEVLFVFILTLIVLILNHFWYYWQTVI